MKKLAAAVLALVMLLTFSGCGGEFVYEMMGAMGASDAEARDAADQYEQEVGAYQEELKEELKEEVQEETDEISTEVRAAVEDTVNEKVGDVLSSITKNYSPSTGAYIAESGNLELLGVDLGYKPGDYFNTTGEPCTCHNHEICEPGYSPCTCLHYPKNGNKKTQCYGFVMYCQQQVFGYCDVDEPGKYTNLGSLSYKAMKSDGSGLKAFMYGRVKPGSHIRTGTEHPHSMIVLSIDENGFRIAQANGAGNENDSYGACKVGTRYYSWKDYVDGPYGYRSIVFLKVPNEVFEGVVDTPTDNQKFHSEDVIIEGWASFANQLPDVYVEVNNDSSKTYGPGAPYTRVDGNPGFQIRIPLSDINSKENSYVVYAVTSKGDKYIMREGNFSMTGLGLGDDHESLKDLFSEIAGSFK